ncbi:MerR family transcriptional regulator [Oleidesulfovibrio alaskensis]|jgi:DNA-binding transcriptional MerR regulator|uniref:MerR family transcriptional regulator n=1 Tax=Oleidesulfovibrio alaskensis TaxID=58180 RepID=UPI00041D3692|nr:MerR family transcriptional regulator [Oleidesulfovibrio alaskensis]MBL3582145.1 MerR family transcriptional regulator [Oleidesulfovibrio alaskensis]
MSGTVYRIGEAARLLNLKTYVLRFWETEFPQLVPERAESGQRLYTEENIALLRQIRYMLHEQGLTIEGARKVLAEQQSSRKQQAEPQTCAPAAPVAENGIVREVIDELQVLRTMLHAAGTDRM